MCERDANQSCGAAGDTGRFRLVWVERESAGPQAVSKVLKVHAHCHMCDSDFVASEPIGLTSISGGAVLSCSHCSNRQAIGQGLFDDLPSASR